MIEAVRRGGNDILLRICASQVMLPGARQKMFLNIFSACVALR